MCDREEVPRRIVSKRARPSHTREPFFHHFFGPAPTTELEQCLMRNLHSLGFDEILRILSQHLVDHAVDVVHAELQYMAVNYASRYHVKKMLLCLRRPVQKKLTVRHGHQVASRDCPASLQVDYAVSRTLCSNRTQFLHRSVPSAEVQRRTWSKVEIRNNYGLHRTGPVRAPFGNMAQIRTTIHNVRL